MTHAGAASAGTGNRPGWRMEEEMREQPSVIARLVDRRRELVHSLSSIMPRSPRGTMFVARGSSEHAALVGRYAAEVASRRPATIAAPSLHNRYGIVSDYAGWVVVGVSQSGQTPEVVDFVTAARAAGATTIGVTNADDSDLSASARRTVTLGAGPERAVPATKTVTATITGLLLIAEASGSAPWRDEWDIAVAGVTDVLGSEPPGHVIDTLALAERVLVVSRGVLTGVAREWALKLQETCGVAVATYSSADLYHGPIAAFGHGVAALVLGNAGPTARDAIDVAQRLADGGAMVVRIGTAFAAPDMALPAHSDAMVTLPAAVLGQQLALGLSRRMGRDADEPQGLTKITRTS